MDFYNSYQYIQIYLFFLNLNKYNFFNNYYHILNPLLTEETFATEVHHITGEGSDAGVVYNEMLACENTMEELFDQKLREMMFNNCGYVYYLFFIYRKVIMVENYQI